ncbi:YopX family protein [Lactiplantibacillus plantarum]|uniref:YopX family protein n=1 Tax=Lactiplantibacillus plantarum TaxID=1590 RepID=UPI00273A14AA|nr:YopX family protein [Lactiplantibacillus plantarum]MDP4437817.1 YopX family protein [Lactiplantibacillus plantarum]MDP4440947.1 YopX family protein [Lactiplantibacillus plantarum]MDP4459549.1 YopX family protein [Lactiplantibacillus plantarum]
MAKMIKFRAWYMPFGKYGAMQEMVYSRASHILALAEMEPEKYIPEQLTGLTDVNGKEIYIGDIVKVWSDMSELTMEPTVNEIVSEDLFGKSGVFLKPAGPHLFEPCLYDSRSNQFEVIGNVHENPELLKG